MSWRNKSLLLAVFTVGYAVPVFHDGVEQGHITSHHIYDPSGLAASHLHRGIYYTHNDGGDKDDRTWLFAVDPKTGQLVATLKISTPNHDWEAIAVAPCGAGEGTSCIYIADTGRSFDGPYNNIIKIREPVNLTDSSMQIQQKLHFKWHQPQSQCMMVNPSGNVYIISEDGVLGKIPVSKWGSGNRHIHITESEHLNISLGQHGALGCDISADGKEMLVKGTDDIYYYAIDNGDVLAAVKAQPEHLPYHFEPLGQAVAWTLSGDGYYTIAQQHNAPFYFYQRESPTTPANTYAITNPSTAEPTTNPPTTITTSTTTTTTSSTTTTTTTTSTTASTLAQTNPPNSPLFNNGQMAGSIKSMDLESVSGLVASHLYRGIYYVHNDRGGTNRIYAVNPTTGDLKATYTITGATNTDWEDIAVGPCPSGGSCIYIADTGAVGGTASNIIYMVKEPMEIKDGALPLMDQLHFKWNEQESECLMVDPTGNVYLISEAIGGGKLAEIPMSAWNSATFSINRTQGLSFQSSHFDPLGCDLSASGNEMLIKTLNNVYYYNVTGGDVFAAVQTPVASLPYQHERQGEAIAWTPSGDGYYTVGEGHHLPFYYYQRQ